MGELEEEPSPYQVAASHLARSRGSPTEIIGPSDSQLRRRRQTYIELVSGMSPEERQREKQKLECSFEKLQSGNFKGTSEIQWKMIVLKDSIGL